MLRKINENPSATNLIHARKRLFRIQNHWEMKEEMVMLTKDNEQLKFRMLKLLLKNMRDMGRKLGL